VDRSRESATFGAVLNGLNHLRAWRGRKVIIKYGGAAMTRADLRASFARDVARLHAAGVHPVVVHGGGPEIDALMRRLGKTPRFRHGLRVTDPETMELVEMVLVGKLNPEIVGLINRQGGHAIGLNGKDDDLIVAHRRPPRCRPGGDIVDLGLVGEVETVNAAPLRLLDAHGAIPVIAPIATGRDGSTYNVNGDHAAGAIAAAVGAAALIQMTDVPGILDRRPRPRYRYPPRPRTSDPRGSHRGRHASQGRGGPQRAGRRGGKGSRRLRAAPPRGGSGSALA